MPIYEYACKNCGKTDTAFRKIDDRHRGPLCCNVQMEFRISTPAVHADLQPYLDPHIGSEPTWVKSKQHRKALMKKNGVSEL